MAKKNSKLASAKRVAEILDDSRTRIAQQFLAIQEKYLKALYPSDWWNDGVALGVSAKVALAYLSMVNASRQYGIVYAMNLLKLAGVNAKLEDIPQGVYIPVRSDTDPQMIAFKAFDSYRSQAVKTPEIRPETFTETFTDEDWKIIEKYLEEAAQRAETVAEMDAVASANRGSTEVYEYEPHVLQYMRVIHPEFSKHGSCGLCVVAATRLYAKHDLMPIHARCHCTTAPVVEGQDWLYELGTHDENLATLYSAAGGNTAKDLKRITVSQTTAHHELGHVLSNSKGRAIGVVEWERPDVQMGRDQMERMYARIRETVSVIERVQSSGKPEKFESGGRSFLIKPDSGNTGMLRKSLAWNRQVLKSLAASLGKSV